LFILVLFVLTLPVAADVQLSRTIQSEIALSVTACSETTAIDSPCATGDTAVAPSTLLTGLVDYYTMDEASGTRADSHGSNDLTANGTGGVGSATGKLGLAADFESTENDYLINTANTTADTDVTICGWFKPESTGAVSEFFSLGAGGNFIARANTTVYQAIYNAFTTFNYTGGADFAAGTWYHVCAWYDAGNNRVGASKNAVINDAVATAPNGAGTDIVIGARDTTPTSPTDGLLDEVAIYSRILTQAEINCLYGSGTPPAYPFVGICQQIAANSLNENLVLYAKLDESGGTRADSVGGHDFTPFGSPTTAAGILVDSVSMTGSDCGTGSCTAGDDLRTPSTTDLQTGSSNFAASVWFYVPATSPATNRSIISKSTEWFCRLNGSDQPNCYTNHELTLLWTETITRDAWTHLYFEVEGTTARMSINGRTKISAAIPTPPIISTNEEVAIGSYFAGTGGFGIGRVDEFGFWKGRNLSAAEQRCLWGAGSPPSFPFSGWCSV